MIAPVEERGWQFDELRKFLDANKSDALLDKMTVVLTNPEERERLDELLLTHFWPRVSDAILGTGLMVMPSKHPDGRPEIHDEPGEYTTRELMFCLHDPERPVGTPNHAPWYLRVHVACSITGYMVSSDFILYLPHTFSLRKVIGLLSRPEFAGCAPELHCEPGYMGPDRLVVQFHHGCGAGWLLEPPDVAVERFTQEMRDHVAIIESTYCLEQDFRSTSAFNELTRRLLTVYRAE